MRVYKRNFLLVFFILLLSSLVSAEVQHYYDLELQHLNGEIKLISSNVVPATVKLPEYHGGFVAEIKSADNKVLNITYFDIPLIEFYDEFDITTGEIIDGRISVLNETNVILKLPYYKNAKEINIYDPDISLKLTIDVIPYSKKAIEEKIPIERFAPREMVKKPITSSWWYGVLIIIFILLIIVIWISKKGKLFKSFGGKDIKSKNEAKRHS